MVIYHIFTLVFSFTSYCVICDIWLTLLSYFYYWYINRSDKKSIRENLRAILNVDLPKRDKDPLINSEFSSECGICYTYSIPSSISVGNDIAPEEGKNRSQFPDQICPNPNCSKIYHHVCILDWLQSLPSSRISFGKIFGQCPYCNESITIESLR